MSPNNEEFSKNFNFLLKIMQDFVNNTKNNSQNDYAKILAEFTKSANSTGLTTKDAIKLIMSSISKIGMPGKDIEEFKKVLQGIMTGGVDRLGKIMDPEMFLKTMDEFFIRVKTLPVNLNNKENISIISKAIARGNRDYASTGLGKKTADFYKNATDKQIIALASIRKQIKDGVQLKNDNNTKGFLSNLIKGTVMGVGGVADVLMENAGFGELPGKFIAMLGAGRDIFKDMDKDKLNAEEERNAFLLDSAKMSEASLLEMSERNEKNKVIIQEGETSKNKLKSDMAKSLEEALNSTSFGKKKKESIMQEFNAGTFDNKRLDEIISSWKKSLGPNVSKENQKVINDFNSAMVSGVTDLQDIEKMLTSLKSRYSEDLEKEAQSMLTVFSNKELVDGLIEKTLAENKKKRDKDYKKKMGSGYTKEVEDMLDKEDAYQVRKQFNVADSEEAGVYNDYKQKLIELHSSQGMTSEEIEKLMETRYKELLTSIERENERKAKISRIYIPEDLEFKDAEKRMTNTRFRNVPTEQVVGTPTNSNNSNRPTRRRNTRNNQQSIGPSPLNNQQTIPLNNNQTPVTNTSTPQTNTRQNRNQNTQLPQNRGNGLVTLEKNSEFMKKQYELMVKIYGADGTKLAKTIANQIANTLLQVKVVNFPGGGGSTSPKGKTTTPPDPP